MEKQFFTNDMIVLAAIRFPEDRHYSGACEDHKKQECDPRRRDAQDRSGVYQCRHGRHLFPAVECMWEAKSGLQSHKVRTLHQKACLHACRIYILCPIRFYQFN